ISLFLSSIALLCSCSQASVMNKNKLQKIQYKNNREDSTTWDLSNFRLDLEKLHRTGSELGIFPSPRYDLIAENSFDGVGYRGEFQGLEINGKTFVYNYFYVKKNKINADHVNNLDEDVFFAIVVLTDHIDTENYSHMHPDMTSRNHPSYLAQGFFKTMNSRINYSAFINSDRSSYAIVNKRLFDLSVGKVVLILPQKDKSLRSIQLDLPRILEKDVDDYLQKVLNRSEVSALYQNPNAI
ncbi:MAG: hypothetical protein AAGA77_25930, partial [Bacteroidota bacterium]